MTPNQQLWVRARNRLASAVKDLGFPDVLAVLLARQMGSPKAIDRMTSYLCQARPGSLETIVDEMVAICDEINAWREKKESQQAQAGYSAWLSSETRWRNMTEDESE